MSLRLDAGVPDHLVPFAEIGADHGREFLRRVAYGFAAVAHETLFDRGVLQRARDGCLRLILAGEEGLAKYLWC